MSEVQLMLTLQDNCARVWLRHLALLVECRGQVLGLLETRHQVAGYLSLLDTDHDGAAY